MSTLSGIDVDEFRKYVVYPVLQSLGMYSRAAEQLLLGTAAQESAMGKYLRQREGGPARGVYQMELSTLNDLYDNYLRYHWELFQKVEQWRITQFHREIDVIGNLYYATALCRVQYYRFEEELPAVEDVQGLARYYKKYWSGLSRTTPAQFASNYKLYINGKG